VESGQSTERETKNLEYIGLILRQRISEGLRETTLKQQQGSLTRENIIFQGSFCEEEREMIKKKIYSNQFEVDN
jgi:hypothetical protein